MVKRKNEEDKSKSTGSKIIKIEPKNVFEQPKVENEFIPTHRKLKYFFINTIYKY